MAAQMWRLTDSIHGPKEHALLDGSAECKSHGHGAPYEAADCRDYYSVIVVACIHHRQDQPIPLISPKPVDKLRRS
jgi:hypothetical protein